MSNSASFSFIPPQAMENEAESKWGFEVGQKLKPPPAVTVRTSLAPIIESVNKNDPRPVIPLGYGDPTTFPSFRTAAEAEDAIIDAVRSAKFNCYVTNTGIPPARRAVADYLNRDLPYKLSPDDVYLTLGCKKAIEVILTVLGRPGANILLPRPGWPFYEGFAPRAQLEIRHFDLLPDKGWDVDLDAVEALADKNTVAMVIINPETARRLKIMVLADEVYAHLTYGSNTYTPMGAFGSIAPVITLGSISKRWIVPGWRFGWLVTNDPNGFLKKSGIVDSIKDCLSVYSDIPTFIQVKLNLLLFEDINDDMEFALKLAKEESVIVTPGDSVGLGNWLRMAFSVEPSVLEDGLGRIKAFCQRHSKKQ